MNHIVKNKQVSKKTTKSTTPEKIAYSLGLNEEGKREEFDLTSKCLSTKRDNPLKYKN